MSWDQDHDHNINTTTYGFPSMSAAFIPPSAARGISRFFLTTLIVAGLLGAGFEVLQCSRVVAQVINDSRSYPAASHHAHRKDR